jgi:hypothetical protein
MEENNCVLIPAFTSFQGRIAVLDNCTVEFLDKGATGYTSLVNKRTFSIVLKTHTPHYIYIYIYVCVCVCVYTHKYTHTHEVSRAVASRNFVCVCACVRACKYTRARSFKSSSFPYFLLVVCYSFGKSDPTFRCSFHTHSAMNITKFEAERMKYIFILHGFPLVQNLG